MSNKNVIEINIVNGKTIIKGLSVGKTLLTATTNGANIKIRVTVKNNIWYKQILEDKTAVYRVPYSLYNFTKKKEKFVHRSVFEKYALEDINGNGIDELLLYGYNRKKYIIKVLIITFDNNKIKPLLYYETYIGKSGIYVRNNELILENGAGDYSYDISYSLKAGKLVRNKEILYLRYHKNNKIKFKYQINGKNVTLKQLKQEYKYFDLNGISKVRFRKI